MQKLTYLYHLSLSVVRAVSVGNNNVFGVGSVVKEGVIVSDGCSVGVKCQVRLLNSEYSE